MIPRVAVIPGRNVIGIELECAARGFPLRELLVGSQTFEDQSAAQLPIIPARTCGRFGDRRSRADAASAGRGYDGLAVSRSAGQHDRRRCTSRRRTSAGDHDRSEDARTEHCNIPHLLSPVVTDPAKAVRAPKRAVETMEDRYRQMSSVGVRSLAGFNDKAGAKAKGSRRRKVQTGVSPDNGAGCTRGEARIRRAADRGDDELADLMMTAGRRSNSHPAARAEGTRGGHPPDHGDAAAVGRRHHRRYQGTTC
jgi:S-DNA-T family DNA segregation ATPase FtsK/SpoIIIE